MSTIPRIAKRYVPCLAGLVLLLTLGATPAAADSISFDLTNYNVNGYTGPYATVDVTLNGNGTATITFTSDTNGGYLYEMTDGSSAAVNVNASNWTVGSVTGNNSDGYTVADPPGTSQVDGFGRFNTTIDAPNSSASSRSTTISFTLTNLGGTPWSSASDVLVANASGIYFAAAHVGACATPCSSSSQFAVTGFAANGTQVPEPASIALLGSGLVALAGMIRKRRKNISAS